MNAPEFKTLADPMFQSIFNKGESTMNDIICETTEEHSHPSTPSTTLISSSSPVDSVSTVSGVSGAVYAPMDTTPRPQAEQDNININLAVIQVTRALENLVTALRNAENPQANLEEAVSTALEQADWFTEKLHNTVQDSIDDKDFDYEIGSAVERYMRNEFDANDHVDFRDIVADRVDDLIDGIVEEKVEEAVEARLSELLEEKLKDANITINF